MINFTDYEKRKFVYGIYSSISCRILPAFDYSAERAFARLTTMGGSFGSYCIVKLEWSQAKLIYDNYIDTEGGADGV